jgi:PDGLE domain
MVMRRCTRSVVLVGLLITLLLAGFGSYYASRSPDGLARVAIDKGMDKGMGKGALIHAFGDSPLAGYSVRGVGSQRLSRGLAGVAGVGLTFLLVGAITVGVRGRGAGSEPGGRRAGQTTGGGGARL